MSDGMSHASRAADDFKAQAYKKYGNMTREELGALYDKTHERIKALREQRDEIQRALDPLVESAAEMMTVYVDYMNSRHPSQRKPRPIGAT